MHNRVEVVDAPNGGANLAGIALGRHLQLRGGAWKLFVAGGETKKGDEDIECAWPISLVAQLERHLATHRTVLLQGAAVPRRRRRDGFHGEAKPCVRPPSGRRLCGRTKEALGKPIDPHMFRHIAATAIATSNPESVTDIKGVLGRVSMTASEEHYNRAGMIGAGTTLQGFRRRLLI